MIIDAHAHVLPPDYPERGGFPLMSPVSEESAREIVSDTHPTDLREDFFRAEARLEALDAAGVDQEVVSPMPPLLNYALPVAVGRDLFRHVNDSIANMVDSGLGRIHGMGIVPLQDPAVAAAELATFAGLGLRGVELGSQVNGVPIGDRRFLEVFQEAERLGLSIFVHTLQRADEVGLAPSQSVSVGVGIEATRGAASLLLGETAQRCSLDHVMFTHAGGGLPSILARADYFWGTSAEAGRSAEPPSAIARRAYYDSMTFDPHGLRFIVDFLGADRIVLGSDFPGIARPARLDDQLVSLGLSEADHARVTHANALNFLHLSRSMSVYN